MPVHGLRAGGGTGGKGKIVEDAEYGLRAAAPALMANLCYKQEKIIIIKKSEWDDIDLSHTGIATRRFFPPDDRTLIDSSILVIDPGKSIPVRKNIKNGQELLCVLKGSVELMLSNEKHALAEGDSVHFWANPINQKITNISADICFVLWVGTL